MAHGRKYATLPDLDSAPDTYETSDAKDSSSKTPRTGQSPSPPASSTASDAGDTASAASASDAEDANAQQSKRSRVDRHSNRPARARDAFSGSRVDARGVDFSDRIDGRTSYRVPPGHRRNRRRRRKREGGGYVDEYGDFSDEEDEEEGFAERLARLKREVEEMQAEGERLASEENDKTTDRKREQQREAQDGISELGKILNSLQAARRTTRSRQPDGAALSSQSQKMQPRNGDVQEDERREITKTHPPAPPLPSNEDINRILIKAADYESRIALLEAGLGASSANADIHPRSNSESMTKNVLTTLAALESKFSILSSSTLPSIESLDRQIRQLTDDASRLGDARAAARAAQESLATARSPLSTPRTGAPPPPTNGIDASSAPNHLASLPEDAEQASRITALYNTLPTIEAAAPLLPAVLDRLKSLRILHADAAVARENLAELEKRQARMDDEIRGWREGLERAEKAFKESEEAGVGNSGAVQEWVKDLERRLDGFSG